MIKMLVMDVDGTLTDGKIYIGSAGEVMKAFSAKDGFGIVQLKNQGIIPVILTGRNSEIVQKRAQELGINEVHQGYKIKLPQLKKVAQKYGVKSSEIAYIGDDGNDLECMNYCGLVGCPNDAHESVLAIADFVANRDGGCGAVREFCDFICTIKE